MHADCYVNFVGFGSTFHLLFPRGSRKHDDAILEYYAAGNSISNNFLKAISTYF